jgi:hypothetical protein
MFMVRNKGQGQNGLDDNRKGNQGDNRQNIKTTNRESLDEDFRESPRKPGKGSQSRKGNLGKTNH